MSQDPRPTPSARLFAWLGLFLSSPLSVLALAALPETLCARDHADFCTICNSTAEIVQTFLFRLAAALLPLLLLILTLLIKHIHRTFLTASYTLGGLYALICGTYHLYSAENDLLVRLLSLALLVAGICFFLAALHILRTEA